MKCPECRSVLSQRKDETPEGVPYNYFKCGKCGEEVVSRRQLHAVANEYRLLKAYTAKISRWGDSLAMRIPKALVKRYGLEQNQEVTLRPEKKAIKILA